MELRRFLYVGAHMISARRITSALAPIAILPARSWGTVVVAQRSPTSNKHAPYWGPRRARSRWQIPRLMLGPCEHPRKDDKGGDNGCNDYCVNGWHDILFRDDRIR